jgi:hypothetical protein
MFALILADTPAFGELFVAKILLSLQQASFLPAVEVNATG